MHICISLSLSIYIYIYMYLHRQMLDVIERADVEMAAGRVENVKKLLNFVVVGGGPTGVEFCGEVDYTTLYYTILH